MIRKVKCWKCGKSFKAEIDFDPDRETREKIICSPCALDDLLEREAADMWRADNPKTSVFACDTATKEKYRALVYRHAVGGSSK